MAAEPVEQAQFFKVSIEPRNPGHSPVRASALCSVCKLRRNFTDPVQAQKWADDHERYVCQPDSWNNPSPFRAEV